MRRIFLYLSTDARLVAGSSASTVHSSLVQLIRANDAYQRSKEKTDFGTTLMNLLLSVDEVG